jgi:REP element-mobilizing transposase RayT
MGREEATVGRPPRLTYQGALHHVTLRCNNKEFLFDVPADDTLSRFMHRVAHVFANRFNRRRERKGHLWEDRFVSTIVEARSYFFRCMAYLDLNPVRARMVAEPGDHPWSGHRAVINEDESFIHLHQMYRELGENCEERRRAYLGLLAQELGLPPRSLVGTLVVGSHDFVWRVRRRLSIGAEHEPRIELIGFGDGIHAARRRPRGGKPGKSMSIP